jgi:hypothetical protein
VQVRRKHLIVGLVAAFGLFLLLAMALLNSSTRAREPRITFAGYTNLPNDNTRFLLFTIENTDLLPLRWRGNAIEVHGSSSFKAPTINHALPWFTARTLKSKSSMTLAIGEPSEGQKWRLVLKFSRYTPREWLRDLQFKYPILGRIPTGPLEPQTITSDWITREEASR